MPYIDKKSRARVDAGGATLHAGEVAYAIQQVIKKHIDQAPDGLRFAIIAEVYGALESAKVDFTERVVIPYEKVKQATNGDVWS
jgi:hypothetical protein